MNKVPVIGLLGGVAAGKTTVANLFAEVGARVIDADDLSRKVTARPEIATQIEKQLGPGLLCQDNSLDRKALAKLVFSDPPARKKLEKIIHPQVVLMIQAQIQHLSATPGPIILDAPLLLEAGLERLCQVLIFVESSPEIREGRAKRRGWDGQEREKREKNQISIETKRSLADYVLINDGSIDKSRAFVRGLLRVIVGLEAQD